MYLFYLQKLGFANIILDKVCLNQFFVVTNYLSGFPLFIFTPCVWIFISVLVPERMYVFNSELIGKTPPLVINKQEIQKYGNNLYCFGNLLGSSDQQPERILPKLDAGDFCQITYDFGWEHHYSTCLSSIYKNICCVYLKQFFLSCVYYCFYLFTTHTASALGDQKRA